MKKNKPFQRLKKILGLKSVPDVAWRLQIPFNFAKHIDSDKHGGYDMINIAHLLADALERLSDRNRMKTTTQEFEDCAPSVMIVKRLALAVALLPKKDIEEVLK